MSFFLHTRNTPNVWLTTPRKVDAQPWCCEKRPKRVPVVVWVRSSLARVSITCFLGWYMHWPLLFCVNRNFSWLFAIWKDFWNVLTIAAAYLALAWHVMVALAVTVWSCASPCFRRWHPPELHGCRHVRRAAATLRKRQNNRNQGSHPRQVGLEQTIGLRLAGLSTRTLTTSFSHWTMLFKSGLSHFL